MKRFFIGTSGWNYQHWKNRFYPPGLAAKEWFSFYSQNFNSVEVNFSFYRWPKKETMKKWHDQSPEIFLFTMKAPRLITHQMRLHDVEGKVNDFYSLTDLLHEKLGCILYQLPPSFEMTKDNLDLLADFLNILDKHKKNVIEFRDKSWWNEETYNLLRRYNVAFCTVSGLDMPEKTVSTAKFAYFRFHGERYAESYSDRELKRYADVMKRSKCDEVYAYFNNDANAYAVKNAKTLLIITQLDQA